jgi:hypothetical protein
VGGQPPSVRTHAVRLEDPAGKDVDTVQRIRDDIDHRVCGLLADLLPDVVPGSAQPPTHSDQARARSSLKCPLLGQRG